MAELVSAMAAGWNAQFIVETWSQGGSISTSVGLAIARAHTSGRHVCIVPDERSRSEYARGMVDSGVSPSSMPEIVVGEAEEAMENLVGVDFLVVDCRRREFSRVLRVVKLSGKGGVMVCKNAGTTKSAARFRWRSVVEEGEGSRRIVRSVFLPVGNGIDMAHVSAVGTISVSAVKDRGGKRWIKHYDQRSGELHVIRR